MIDGTKLQIAWIEKYYDFEADPSDPIKDYTATKEII
jgi:hypothetical protein